jgi:hypothetical protein
MENTTRFDLNLALQHWLESLRQSPQVKSENLKELESHVRDSVVQLQTKGLSSEESFMVATHRVGNPTQLEPEFAKVNRSPWNAIVHGLILAFFSLACWFLWGVTMVSRMMAGASARQGRPLPAFSQLVIDCGPWLAVPPLLALAYCLYIWVRRSSGRNSWMGFFAVVMAVLFLLTMPILIAAFLPLIDFIYSLPANASQP